MASIVFSVNGEKHELDAKTLDPRKTLAEFLRRDLALTGTKISCAEGGCGACTVTIEEADGQFRSANACLFPLPNLDGLSIITTEGLGGKGGKNLHPVQDRIAKFNGLQCGFCTPGMVSNTYSLLKEHGDDLTPEQVESLFDGNLCRCTGYRPLLDAAKSLCQNNDIEDMVGCGASCSAYKSGECDPKFPEFLKEYKPCEKTLDVASEDGTTRWLRPTSLEDALAALAETKADIVRPVVSNTGAAIYKDTYQSYGGPSEVLVSLWGIKSFHAIETTGEGLKVGGSASLRNFEKALKAASDKTGGVFGRMASHIARIGNRHIRSAGSLAGNLTLCKKFGFWSDAAVVCMAAGAQLTLVSNGLKRETQTVSEFIASSSFASPDQLLESVFIPFPAAGSVWRSYKLSMRPQNAHALANAAFKVVLDGDKIIDANLVFGAVSDQPGDIQHAVLATKTAAAIVGQSASAPETLKAALAALKEEVVPRGHEFVEYRAQLHQGFLFKLFRAISGDKLAQEEEDGFASRPATKSSQKFFVGETEAPVHEPIPKLQGPNLVAGDAKFGDDFAAPYNCLYASYVYSTQARAVLKSVDPSAALKMPGVVRYIDAKDIKGANNCSPTPGDTNKVFATDRVSYYGQPIGLILATSTRLAKDAADLVAVEYDTEGKKPVLTIAQSKAEGMMLPVVANTKNKEGPTAAEALESSKKTLTGTVEIGSQLHFYMEGQNVNIIPDEDDSLIVQTGCQAPGGFVDALTPVLGISQNRIRLTHRRSGGGFGGRLSHGLLFAAGACVAAQVTGRAIKLVVARDLDSQICGGREEASANYKVGFDETGKITALSVDVTLASGHSVDLSWFSNAVVPQSMNECYDIPAYDFTSSLCITNAGTRTAVRGPGEIPASYTMETILARVAEDLGKSVDEVRQVNMYSSDPAVHEKCILPNGAPVLDYTVPEMWDQLSKKTDYEAAKASVAEFNKTHKWTKRGVSFLPMRYGVSVFPKGAFISIQTDGSITVFHGCSDIGQGCNTKVGQAVISVLSKLVPVPLENIRFGDYDSWILPNESFTGGSTGSEGAVVASMKAAEELVTKLTPFLETLKKTKEEAKEEGKEAEAVSWTELAAAGSNNFPSQPTRLVAHGQYAGGGDESLAYENYGVGFGEVEIDVLTGQVRILKSSIMYDCGKSLNPAVDIGQAEGAYVMGLGHYLREQVRYDENNGKCLTMSTWEYKPSFAGDIPEIFEVEFLNKEFKKGILSSKASGEPPLVLSGAVVMAVREAITDARKEAGVTGWFDMEIPATAPVIRRLCAVSAENFA